MNPAENPFSPGAGTKPPELVGRDEVLEKANIMLQRVQSGRDARGLMLVGLRGVGKTVLLNQIQRMADAQGAQTALLESPEQRSLPAQVLPALRTLLLKLSRKESAKALAERALRALGGFLKAIKVKFQDVELGVDLETELGLADSGDFEADLSDLMQTIGEAARAGKTAVILLIDELQYVAEDQLASLVVALHRCNHNWWAKWAGRSLTLSECLSTLKLAH
jgi:Cdc6-like AAA superfamily ATPase